MFLQLVSKTSIALFALMILGAFGGNICPPIVAQEEMYFELAHFGEALESLRDEELEEKLIDSPKSLALRRLMAKRFFFAGDIEKCLAQLSSAIEIRPDDPLLYVDRGKIQFLHHDLNSALRDLSKAINLEINRVDARRLRADINSQIGNTTAALEDCDFLISRLNSPDDHALRGLVFLRARDYTKSILNCDAALFLDDGNWCAYKFRATARRNLGDFELAIGDAERMISIKPRVAEGYELLAELHMELGAKAKVVEAKTRLLSVLDRGTAEYYVCEMNLLLLRDDYAKLIDESRELLRERRDISQIWSLRGRAYFALGEVDKAIGDFTEAIRLAPHDEDCLLLRGYALLRQKNLDPALDDCNAAVMLCRSPKSLNLRGLVQTNRGELDDALADFSASIELEPSRAETYLQRSDVLRFKGNLMAAREDVERGLQLMPNLPTAYMKLSIIDVGLQHFASALTAAETALSFDASWAPGHIQRGRVLEYLNREPEALAAYGEALKSNGENMDALRPRGRLYRKMGRYEGAIEDFQNMRRIDPDSCDAILEGAATWRALRNYAKSRELIEEAVRQHPRNPEAARMLSWSLATDADEDARDGRRAVELAREAMRLNKTRNFKYPMTLAVALGECGDFGKALEILGDLGGQLTTDKDKSDREDTRDTG